MGGLLLSPLSLGLLNRLLLPRLLLSRRLLVCSPARHFVIYSLLLLELPHLASRSTVALPRTLGESLDLGLALLIDCSLITHSLLPRAGRHAGGLNRQPVGLSRCNHLPAVVEPKLLLHAGLWHRLNLKRLGNIGVSNYLGQRRRVTGHHRSIECLLSHDRRNLNRRP